MSLDDLKGALLPVVSPRAFEDTPGQGAAGPVSPATPCATCTVRHLCLRGSLDEGTRQALAPLTIGRRRVRKGQKLYREGDAFGYLYAVRMGTFKSALSLHDGVEHVIGFYLPGDVMGLDGTADGVHPSSATALEHSEVCAIPYAELTEACAELKPLRRRLAQSVGRQLVREYRAIRLMAGRSSEQRVAGFLMELSEGMRIRGYSSREFRLRMSRAEIGSYLGTTLETVSRCFSRFANQGLIAVDSRRIELLQPQALRDCLAGSS